MRGVTTTGENSYYAGKEFSEIGAHSGPSDVLGLNLLFQWVGFPSDFTESKLSCFSC